jgi:hypothetical protein
VPYILEGRWFTGPQFILGEDPTIVSIRKLAVLAALLLAVFAAALSVACGDDSSSSSGGSSGSVKTGSDDQYVGDMCKAFAAYATAMDKATKDLGSGSSVADVSKIMEQMAKPTEQLANDFAKMKPPADLKDWHTGATKSLKDAVSQLKDSKDLSGANAMSDIPDMPKAADDRLAKLAADNKDCKAANGLFGQ